jgi:hypothetical protein
MNNAVDFDKNENIIKATVIGLFNTNVAVEIFAEIDKFINEYYCKKILVDCIQAIEQEKLMNVYGFSDYLFSLYREQDIKLAFVKDRNRRLYDFFEVTVRHRGIDLKIFDNIISAKAWLLK